MADYMTKTFKNEFATLKSFEDFLNNQPISQEELISKYKLLISESKNLLRKAIKIASISDINQKKLYKVYHTLEEQKKELYYLSITDRLTGIYNRSYILDYFRNEYTRSLRYHFNLSCILFDIDDFKLVNDRYGHLIGDFVLKSCVEHVIENIRESDVFGRYGGEEFLIILPNTSMESARIAAEKIRTNLEKAVFKNNGISVKITISLGISDIINDKPETNDKAISNADLAMYEAKKNGKNRTVLYSELKIY